MPPKAKNSGKAKTSGKAKPAPKKSVAKKSVAKKSVAKKPAPKKSVAKASPKKPAPKAKASGKVVKPKVKALEKEKVKLITVKREDISEPPAEKVVLVDAKGKIGTLARRSLLARIKSKGGYYYKALNLYSDTKLKIEKAKPGEALSMDAEKYEAMVEKEKEKAKKAKASVKAKEAKPKKAKAKPAPEPESESEADASDAESESEESEAESKPEEKPKKASKKAKTSKKEEEKEISLSIKRLQEMKKEAGDENFYSLLGSKDGKVQERKNFLKSLRSAKKDLYYYPAYRLLAPKPVVCDSKSFKSDVLTSVDAIKESLEVKGKSSGKKEKPAKSSKKAKPEPVEESEEEEQTESEAEEEEESEAEEEEEESEEESEAEEEDPEIRAQREKMEALQKQLEELKELAKGKKDKKKSPKKEKSPKKPKSPVKKVEDREEEDAEDINVEEDNEQIIHCGFDEDCEDKDDICYFDNDEAVQAGKGFCKPKKDVTYFSDNKKYAARDEGILTSIANFLSGRSSKAQELKAPEPVVQKANIPPPPATGGATLGRVLSDKERQEIIKRFQACLEGK